MVKDVTKFHKHYLGVGVCLNVCVYRILSFGREGGREIQSSVLTWWGCTVHIN